MGLFAAMERWKNAVHADERLGAPGAFLLAFDLPQEVYTIATILDVLG